MKPTRPHRFSRLPALAGIFVLAGCMTVLELEDLDYQSVCTSGKVQCSENTPQTCDGGLWNDLPPCVDQTCIEGSCKGECGPGQKRCKGNLPQTCDGEGHWQDADACAEQTCIEGVCVGMCAPDQKRCLKNLPQSCDSGGNWKDEAACLDDAPFCVGGICTIPPSCIDLPNTCGAPMTEGCCFSPLVDGGTFNRSNDANFPAQISPFRLDRFEVSVGRFRKFVGAYPGNQPKEGAGAHPHLEYSGWKTAWEAYLSLDQMGLQAALKCDKDFQTWTDTPENNEALPINCVTWFEAFAFCAWDGGRLPTEAEWNYAAAGGDQQRVYPWSNPPPSTAINSSYAVYDCKGDGSIAGACSAADIRHVGSTSKVGDGLWGQADLAGNIWEWTLDWYYGAYVNPCVDCANLDPLWGRVLRGGSWVFDASFLLSSYRHYEYPTHRSAGSGFRCARDL